MGEIICECDNCYSSMTHYFDTEYPDQAFCDSDCAIEYYSEKKTKVRKIDRIDIKIDSIIK